MGKSEVISVIGPNRAGKDTVSNIISDKLSISSEQKIPIYQISAPLRLICAERGLEMTRENLIAIGTELSTANGDGCLAEWILDHSDSDRMIIAGIRQLGQLALLGCRSNLITISVDATPDIRFNRALADKSIVEASSLREFIKRESIENSPPNVQRVFECMEKADHHIMNNGTLLELNNKIDSLLNKIDLKG